MKKKDNGEFRLTVKGLLEHELGSAVAARAMNALLLYMYKLSTPQRPIIICIQDGNLDFDYAKWGKK